MFTNKDYFHLKRIHNENVKIHVENKTKKNASVFCEISFTLCNSFGINVLHKKKKRLI